MAGLLGGGGDDKQGGGACSQSLLVYPSGLMSNYSFDWLEVTWNECTNIVH